MQAVRRRGDDARPGRLQVTWDDDSPIKIDTDAGKQTRLLNFDKSGKPVGERTWQGYSPAPTGNRRFSAVARRRCRPRRGRAAPADPSRS